MNLSLDDIPVNKVFFVKRNDRGAMSLVKKMAREHRPGEIILLTDDEFRALKKSFVSVEYK